MTPFKSCGSEQCLEAIDREGLCPQCRAKADRFDKEFEAFMQTPEMQARLEAARLRPDGRLFPELAEPDDDD